MSELEHACIRTYCLDWTREGRVPRVCANDCDDRTRQMRGCVMCARYSGHGRLYNRNGDLLRWCTSGLRRTGLYQEIASLFDGGILYQFERPEKLLQGLNLVTQYRAERAERLRDDRGT